MLGPARHAVTLVLLLASWPVCAEPNATIRVAQPEVRAVDGVTVDIDAAPLRDSSNLRLVVVPADAPDAIADPNAFAAEATHVNAGRVRLTLPNGPPGRDEVRLYHVPRFATAYAVAARAPVTVLPGIAGALTARDLGREARALGPVRFEAQYRDSPVVLQAQFLRARPDTEWDVRWFAGVPVDQAARRFAVVSLGTRGVVPDRAGTASEAVCVIDVEDRASLAHVAALSSGDAVAATGNPSVWSAGDAVLMRNCRLIP